MIFPHAHTQEILFQNKSYSASQKSDWIVKQFTCDLILTLIRLRAMSYMPVLVVRRFVLSMSAPSKNICKIHPVFNESAERMKLLPHTKEESGAAVLDIFNKLKPRYKKTMYITYHPLPPPPTTLSINCNKHCFSFPFQK